MYLDFTILCFFLLLVRSVVPELLSDEVGDGALGEGSRLVDDDDEFCPSTSAGGRPPQSSAQGRPSHVLDAGGRSSLVLDAGGRPPQVLDAGGRPPQTSAQGRPSQVLDEDESAFEFSVSLCFFAEKIVGTS